MTGICESCGVDGEVMLFRDRYLCVDRCLAELMKFIPCPFPEITQALTERIGV